MKALRLFKVLAVALCCLIMFATPARAIDSVNDLQTPFYDPTSNAGGGSCSMSGSIALLMEAIAMHESHGDPTAQNDPNNPASASGKYQIIQPTWQGLSAKYYPPAAQQYPIAKDAPEAIQDAVVYLTFADYLSKQYSAFQIAVIWYGGATVLSDIANQFNTIPGGNTQSFGGFGNEMAQFVQAGAATDAIAQANGDSPRYNGSTPLSSIPILAQSAPDFTTDLAKYGTLPPLNISSYGSDGKPTGGGLSITGGDGCSGVPASNFVFYSQYDSRWATHPIFDGTDIADSGCGPTSVAMVVATLADSTVTPIDTGDYMTQIHGYTGSGSSVDGLSKAVEKWGLSATSISTSDQAIQIIKNGGLVIAGGKGLSPFSGEGHVIVLRAIDSGGNFLVGNSAPGLQTSQDEPFSWSDLQAAGIGYMIGVTK